MDDFVSAENACLKKNKRLTIYLFAAAAFVFASAAHADPKQPASSQDGKYFDADGNPTYNVSADGKVDWETYSGFRRYHSECHVCHGPDGMGSTYAPALVDSLKTMDYGTFVSTVAQGKKDLAGGQEKVMPTLGTNKNVMCYIDDIYVYLKARSDGALGRARPAAHEEKTESWTQAQNSCMGAAM